MMEIAYVSSAFGCLLFVFAWNRASLTRTHARRTQIASVRSSFAEVETSVLTLLASANETRNGWQVTATLFESSNAGPAPREMQILELAIQKANFLDRQMGISPMGVGQMSATDVGAFSASLQLWSGIVREQQLAVDASQLRLEAIEKASGRKAYEPRCH